MKPMKVFPLAGLAGVAGLVVLGLGGLGGCSSEDHPAGHQETKPADDGHKGHDQGADAAPPKSGDAPAKPTAALELKPREPSASYPLKTCVVSGDSLTEMGGPVAYDYGGTEVQFCCKNCIKEFQKDPETYLKKIRDAAK